MLEKLQDFNQIFVLGLTATGKSFFAKELSTKLNKEYYNFDMQWDYTLESKHPLDFINKIKEKENLIIDGVPYFEDGTYIKNIFIDFIDYLNKNNIAMVCVFFEDVKKWVKTVISKEYYNIGTMGELNGNYFIKQWYECYEKSINIFISKCKIDRLFFYNIDLNKFIDKEQFILKKKKIEKNIEILKSRNLLRIYIDMLKQEKDYDAYYQDIECIDFIGYSKSFETWERIKKINFEDKIIFDIGCFHGYFSFIVSKIAKCVYGVDISNRVLDTCNILKNVYKNKNIEFYQWCENDIIPDNVDIVLCLNVLHHFKNQETFLQKIKTGIECIFEIGNEQREMVEKYFKIEERIDSHRENRIILRGVKNI